MKNLILWQTNFNLTREEILRLDCEITRDTHPPDVDFYTSYGRSNTGLFLGDRYVSELNKCLKDLNLENRFNFHTDFWVQKYTNNSEGHHLHDHWSPTAILSWVHFIKVPSSPCFCFEDFEKGLYFPSRQGSGDFIVFPPWALHKTTPFVENTERLIVAGNVSIVQ